MMKKVHLATPNRVMVLLMLASVVINGFAIYTNNALISNITKITCILLLLSLYYIIRQRMANVFLTIFLFSFIGDAFYVFNLGDLSSKLSTTFYLGSYCLLTFVLLGKFKRIKYEGLVSIYLVIVLMLNTYFLYILYGMIKESFSDDVNLVLSICHGVLLIAMSFFAFAVYLSQETTQSIIFLVMVCCFVFSDILNYICSLYVYYWMFEFMSNMLHVLSLALLYMYVYNHHKIVKVKRREEIEPYLVTNSDRITA